MRSVITANVKTMRIVGQNKANNFSVTSAVGLSLLDHRQPPITERVVFSSLYKMHWNVILKIRSVESAVLMDLMI